MGRKKRKTSTEASLESEAPVALPLPLPSAAQDPGPTDPRQQQQQLQEQQQQLQHQQLQQQQLQDQENQRNQIKKESQNDAPASSGYAMTSHSAEVIGEDIYVSDGSDDSSVEGEGGEGEGDEQHGGGLEIVLSGSRMGLMRRGLAHSMLVQPKRQWVRQEASAKDGGEENDEEAEKKRKQEEEDELAKLDPAQRAAKLLAEKQRKLEEAKENARRLESEENAGRDPCLFSKRTAFDIRFDQIDDKPWTRGAGDFTDFFNYGLTEEDWLEYSQQQLMIRQELTDASRQRRVPDPAIVPVKPRAPSSQTPKVAVNDSSGSNENGSGDADGSGTAPVAGPEFVKKEEQSDSTKKEEDESTQKLPDVHVGAGGAWGAGAPPGSVLAKLIEEQERKNNSPKVVYGGTSSVNQEQANDGHYGDRIDSGHRNNFDNQSDYGSVGSGGQWGGSNQDYGRGGHDYGSYRGRGGGRGGRGGGRGFFHGGRGNRGYPPSSWGGRGDFQSRKRSRDDYGW